MGAKGQATAEEVENELFRGCPPVGGTRRIQQVFRARRRKRFPLTFALLSPSRSLSHGHKDLGIKA